MTWIKTIPSAEAGPELRAAVRDIRGLYPPEYGREAGAVAAVADPARAQNITGSHSLIPSALRHAFATLGVLLSPDLPLSRREHEMIALVVSVTNHCFY